MKRGLIAALLTVTIAALQMSTAEAKVPLLREMPDVFIGDNPKVTPGNPLSMGVFVFPDAFDVQQFTISVGENGSEGIDGIASATKATLKWSFFEIRNGLSVDGADILINGLLSLDPDPGNPNGPLEADILDPPLGKRIAGGPNQDDPGDFGNADIVQGDPGDVRPDIYGGTILAEDGVTYTLTFRDRFYSSLPTFPWTDFDDFEASPGFAQGEINNRTIALFASNYTTYAIRTITVITDWCASDSVTSTTIFEPVSDDELFQLNQNADGSIDVGGITWFPFGPVDVFGNPIGGDRFYLSTRGMCVEALLTGGSTQPHGWAMRAEDQGSGVENAFDITNETVYRLRTFANISDAGTAEVQPLWTVDWRNQEFTRGVLTYGGARWHFDDLAASGGNNVISDTHKTNGREYFDDFFAPISVDHANWKVEAFAPAADINNNAQFFWRVIDGLNPSIGTETRLGTICIERIKFDSVPFAILFGAGVGVYDKVMHDGSETPNQEGPIPIPPPPGDRTYRTQFESNAGNTIFIGYDIAERDIREGTAVLEIPEPTSTVRSDPNGLAGVQIFPADQSTSGLLRNFPIVRGEEELFIMAAEISTDDNATDPVTLIEMDWLSSNIEAGQGDYVTFGNDVPGGMFRAGSPKQNPNTYVSFFFGNGAPLSGGGNAGVGFLLKFFNLGDFGGGSDNIVVENLRVLRVDGLDLETIELNP
jgi:hypothetical protein